ncbi:DUF5069 domain-containing protein [Akkermansiaceae bacterium]|nr:DUF5069 domain-containing protein [Akkermansiaceae bacterium]
MDWNDTFTELYKRCLEQYKSGNTDFTSYYTEQDLTFLSSIGYKKRELFDFIEDYADSGTPTPTTALLVASVRRDFFLVVQEGQKSSTEITSGDLPSSGDSLGGIAYLPRIIKKAQAKLAGELDPDLMYACGGDKKFLKNNGNIHPADFLRNVWASDGDEQKILAYVKTQISQ